MEAELEPFVRHGTGDEWIEVSADEVLKAIAEGRAVDIEYAIIEGDIDIAGLELDKDEQGRSIIASSFSVELSSIKGEVSFIKASFEKGARFGRVIFEHRADFSQASFGEIVGFEQASFERVANFYMTSFGGMGLFFGTNFCEVAYFLGAYFGESVFFNDASFGEEAQFGLVSFGGRAQFFKASFEKEATFLGASFEKEATFLGASFEKEAIFRGASFEKEAAFRGVKMKYPADFAGVRIRENTVCKAVLWNWVLRRLFWLPVWLMTIGRIKLPKAIFTDIRSINTVTVMDASSNPRLKRYIDDEQWIESWRSNPKGRWWREPVFWVWGLTSHCGRSIGLWAFWSILFILLFAFAYTPAPAWMGDSWCDFWQEHGTEFEQRVSTYEGKPMSFHAGFYFSIVNFTTLGFGDIVAANSAARFLVGLEVVLGYVMLGGLISIFANKFARRS